MSVSKRGVIGSAYVPQVTADSSVLFACNVKQEISTTVGLRNPEGICVHWILNTVEQLANMTECKRPGNDPSLKVCMERLPNHRMELLNLSAQYPDLNPIPNIL